MTTLVLALALLSGPGAAPRGAAKLGVVVGTVETKTGEAGAYAPAAAGAELEADVFVRTGPGARAALDFADGTELRLHENTELHLQGARKAALKLGSVFALVAKDEAQPFEITTQYAPLKAGSGTFLATFLKRDPASKEYKMVSRTETIVAVLAGKVNVISKRYAQFVTAGYICNMVDAQLNTPDPIPEPYLITGWVHEILAARGKAGQEAAQRANGMIGRMSGAEKDPFEAGLRGLGALGVPEMSAYLKYPGTGTDHPRRRAVARVLADVAPAAPSLLPLLKDADGQVRQAGARGLKRLTGEDLGKDEAWWAGDKAATEGHALWEARLKK
jgi:hypothetical protein